MPNLSIIAIGNELLNGSVLDTNSQYLAQELYHLGFKLHKVAQVGDYIDDICNCLNEELQRSDLIITTGGLGPTTDDLTRNAIAKIANVKLLTNQQAKDKLISLLEKRGRVANKNNLQQIEFPEGAEIITNDIGTADCFITKVNNIPIISLPGVPKEMKHIFNNYLKLILQKTFLLDFQPVSTYFRTFGISEAVLGEKIESFKLPNYIEVSYRPHLPDILITLKHQNKKAEQERINELNNITSKLIEHIGKDYIYSRNENDSLAKTISQLLREKKASLSLAESCSGGLLADSLISLPGASEFLISSVVSYSNEAKIKFLGVNPETIEKFGAVSEETACEMAKGIREKTNSTYALSITGIAGPDGGSLDKPVGTFYVGLATSNTVIASKNFYPQERNLFRLMTVGTALNFLRIRLAAKSLGEKKA